MQKAKLNEMSRKNSVRRDSWQQEKIFIKSKVKWNEQEEFSKAGFLAAGENICKTQSGMK